MQSSNVNVVSFYEQVLTFYGKLEHIEDLRNHNNPVLLTANPFKSLKKYGLSASCLLLVGL